MTINPTFDHTYWTSDDACKATQARESLEKLAEFAHNEQWSGWMKYLFSKCTFNEDGTATIPSWAVERWGRQVNTRYADLAEEEKESDRFEAVRMIHIMQQS